MACEYLGHEYKPDKARVWHESAFCTANGEGCLVEDPPGFVNCTRRTWLKMQGTTAPPEAPKRPMKKKGQTTQYALL